MMTVELLPYAPKQDVLVGKWNPPPVTVIQALPGLSVQ